MTSSENEIQEKYLENNGLLCGRVTGKFLSQQYQKQHLKQRSLRQIKIFFIAALLGFGSNLFTIQELKAHSFLTGIRTQLLSSMDTVKLTTIKGEVKDKDSGEVLPFANVTLMVNDSVIIGGSSTNIDGYFEIQVDPVKYPVVAILVSYIGYEKTLIKNIDLKESTTITISIKASGAILGGFEPGVYQVPLIDPFKSSKTIDREEYRRMPK
jgi:hypothetical protein